MSANHTQSRRAALAALAVGALATARSAGAAVCDNPAASFAAHSDQAWALGYANLPTDMGPIPLKVRGRIPTATMGAFFRNGPARHQLADMRYAHWFDGDGAIQRYTLSSKGIQHQAQFIRTAKYVADNAAGKIVRQAFGTRTPAMEAPTSADALNVANTSVVHHGGRLLALWEGGSAHEVDPMTLHTKGTLRWSEETAGLPFSAHPRIEPDGTLWNFGVNQVGGGALVIYRIKPDGVLATASVLPVKDMGMVHDFAVTQNHLVFLIPPLVFQGERFQNGQSILGSYAWTPKLGLRVLVLPKVALDQPRWYELPVGMVFHVGNACEEGGVIRLDCMRSATAWSATDGLRDVMCGDYQPQEHTQAMLVELDLATQRARQTVMPLVAEFPRVDPRLVGQPYTQVFAAARQSAKHRPGYDSVARWNVVTGVVDQYHYGDDVHVEEHIFVPHTSTLGKGEAQGY